jgi:error-prone DNA polymerase
MYGVVRFAEAAVGTGVGTVYGAELRMGLIAPTAGEPDPESDHLLLLARGLEGYRALCRAISAAQLRGGMKGRPDYVLEDLAATVSGRVVALTGCRKGTVRRALRGRGIEAAAAEVSRLIELFGRDHVVVELTDHDHPDDAERNDLLAELATRAGLLTVATNAVHYASPERYPLSTALAAVRARRRLDEMDGWLPGAAAAYLRSGVEMAARFDPRHPGAVARAAELGRELAFELSLVAPALPPFAVPGGGTEAEWLRELALRGAARRYGSHAENPEALDTIQREMDVIEERGLPGYFLIVYDIVSFCRREDILCQGRGSAANSAVCFALGITNVDAVRHGLLFERFLSRSGTGTPTSTSTSSPLGESKSSSMSPTHTGVLMRPRWRTSSPTALARRYGTWRRCWASPRNSRRAGAGGTIRGRVGP